MRIAVLAAAILCLRLAAQAAEPDQVLVLYNADYAVDQDDSAPGQDSQEVAEYYVRRHTDPRTGKKPYVLGLRCAHGNDHLNTFRLPEESKDNYFGIEYTGNEKPPADWPVADSRHADIFVGKEEAEKLDLDSATIALGKEATRAEATVVFGGGKAPEGIEVKHAPTPDGGYGWRLNARSFLPGKIHLWFEADGKQGHDDKRLHFVYHDFLDFKVSTTGRDGIRDDKNYLEDVELPVKAFLEDPRNALRDGALLKDRILYIVVCHGLPKAVESMYGVSRGATGSLGNHGDGSSLQQRLMMLYYDVTKVDFVYLPTPQGMHRRFFRDGTKVRFSKYVRNLTRDSTGVQQTMICNALNFGLVGQFNPYRHPRTFLAGRPGKLVGMYDQKRYEDPDDRLAPLYPPGGEASAPPHFSTELRKSRPRQCFLYWAMRIDGPAPAIAKAQVDGAIYAGSYLTPGLGTCYNRLNGPEPIQPAVRLGIDELKEAGFKLQPKLSEPPAVIERPMMFSAYFGNGPNYYDEGKIVGWDGMLPGSIVCSIKSSNRWKRSDDQFATYFEKMIEAGATVTAGLGAQGGAHITSASWWDDRILYHHLFRGWELGECLLMSTHYLDWVTAYVGDPLYRPTVFENKPDTIPPMIDDEAFTAEMLPAKDSYCAVLTVPLQQAPANPEMAEISAVYEAPGRPEQRSRSWRFSVRPRVILRDLTPGAQYKYTLKLTDPYGNATTKDGSLQVPAAAPSKVRHEEAVEPGAKAAAIAVARYPKKDRPPMIAPDAGEIEIEFTPNNETFTLVKITGFTWTSKVFTVGGATARMHEPLKFEVGRGYRAVARWRRRPLTREVYLIAPDGTEFLAASNNTVPWGVRMDGNREIDTAIHGTAYFGDIKGDIQIHAVRIRDNANPAPDEHLRPYVKKFRMAEYEAAK